MNIEVFDSPLAKSGVSNFFSSMSHCQISDRKYECKSPTQWTSSMIRVVLELDLSYPNTKFESFRTHKPKFGPVGSLVLPNPWIDGSCWISSPIRLTKFIDSAQSQVVLDLQNNDLGLKRCTNFYSRRTINFVSRRVYRYGVWEYARSSDSVNQELG